MAKWILCLLSLVLVLTAVAGFTDYNPPENDDDDDNDNGSGGTTLRRNPAHTRPSKWTTSSTKKSDYTTPVASTVEAAKRALSKKAIFGLFDPLEEVIYSGISILSEDGSVNLTRWQHYIGEYPVWNSGGVLVETVVPGGVPILSVLANKVYKRAAALYSLSLAGKLQKGLPANAALDSYSACQDIANDDLDGEIQSPSINFASRRYIYMKSQDASSSQNSNPDDVILVDNVIVTGQLKNTTLFAHHCLCNALTHEVVLHWNNLASAIYGGNQKLGQWQYGSNGKADLPYTQINRACRFETQDSQIKVFNARNYNQWNASDVSNEFNCNIGLGDSVNGGYGVLADLFDNAVKARQMFLDPAWGGLVQDVNFNAFEIFGHVGQLSPVTFFDPATNRIFFGDGDTSLYPLGTCLDIVAHEMAHSVTNLHSKLMYVGESGCLNEGFSDAMGEMAKAYATNSSDFKVGTGCVKNKPYVRTMLEPKRYSEFFPTCSDDSTNCQEVHNCSSVVNYIFYKLANSRGWSTRLAGRAWLAANRVAWTSSISIKQAGCDVANVVLALNITNGDSAAVVKAWSSAGIDITDCAPKSTTPQTGTRSTNATRLENCSKQIGLVARAQHNQFMFAVTVPSIAATGWIQMYADNGDADFYLSFEKPPTKSNYSYGGYTSSSQEFLLVTTRPGVEAYILIEAYKPFHDLWLYACFF